MPDQLEILPKKIRPIIERYRIQKRFMVGLFARGEYLARQAFKPDPRSEHCCIY